MTRQHCEDTQTLLGMLTYKRPAGSKTERRFIRNYIRPLGVECDKVGNLYKRIGNAPVLWSCHTDTVHRDGGRQHLELADYLIGLHPRSTSNCLGADDTAGVWLMCEMIKAQRPGLYVFHRAEEIGGVGSYHISLKEKARLEGIECAVAFDRRGTHSVITHQGTRTCSDVFATSLARQLGSGFELDSGGTFTDTANYTDLVGECTNVSVGYYDEHTSRECLDIDHLFALRDALLALDTGKLEYVRFPGEWDNGDWSCGAYVDEYDQSPRKQTMLELVQDHPREVVDLLEDYGFDWTGLAQEIWDRTSGTVGRR